MLVKRLRLEAFRRFIAAEVCLQPGLNLITGDNGSGKTSLLEALHLVAHGRSFRGRVRDGLVRSGESALQVFVEWEQPATQLHRAGLRHSGSNWEARLDGAPVAQLGQLCEALAVVSFEPGSHALIDGSAEVRRRYLDWGLFHVEPSFMPHWRRYARALKQRNALLRTAQADAQLDAWEHELATAGETLTQQREIYVSQLQPHLNALLPQLLPAAGDGFLRLQPGWRREELSLADALLLSRERDRVVGYTALGPHRADLRLNLRDLPGREGLSRGQAKQAALSLLLTQAAQLAAFSGHWPLLQLDDLGSELDRKHQRQVLEVLSTHAVQVLITGTELPLGLTDLDLPRTMFHVEHGNVQRSN